MLNEKAASRPIIQSIAERARKKREENRQPEIKKYEITPFLVVSYIVMFIFAIVTLAPLIWLIRTALVPSSDALQLFKLSAPTLDNIKSILNAAPFGQYYINTIIMVAAVLLVQFISITLAGYAFARIDFYGKNFLFMLFQAIHQLHIQGQREKRLYHQESTFFLMEYFLFLQHR